MGIFSKGLKKEFETAKVNEPSEFEPVKFYCIYDIFQAIFFLIALGWVFVPVYVACGVSNYLLNPYSLVAATLLKILEFANSVDLDEAAQYEPPHLKLCCLPGLLSLNSQYEKA